jgi:homoserine acetyltransferase
MKASLAGPRGAAKRALLACCLANVCMAAVARAAGGDLQFAELRQCKLESGKTIENCRVGYRTFGKLNADADLALWALGGTGTAFWRRQQIAPTCGFDALLRHCD